MNDYRSLMNSRWTNTKVETKTPKSEFELFKEKINNSEKIPSYGVLGRIDEPTNYIYKLIVHCETSEMLEYYLQQLPVNTFDNPKLFANWLKSFVIEKNFHKGDLSKTINSFLKSKENLKIPVKSLNCKIKKHFKWLYFNTTNMNFWELREVIDVRTDMIKIIMLLIFKEKNKKTIIIPKPLQRQILDIIPKHREECVRIGCTDYCPAFKYFNRFNKN